MIKADWTAMLTIFLALVAASLFEHKILAPRMTNSPGKTTAASTPIANTASDYVKIHHPNAISVS